MCSAPHPYHLEDETAPVEMGDTPARSDDNHKQCKAMWWCCFGRRGEDMDNKFAGGGSSAVHRTALASFQRIRRDTSSSVGSNHWEGETNSSDACRLRKGWRNSVRRTREWCEDAVGSSRPKWKRLVAKFKSNIDGMRSTSFHSKPSRFKYDALSYALNFDEGTSRLELESSYPAFSARFAAPRANPLDKEGLALNELPA